MRGPELVETALRGRVAAPVSPPDGVPHSPSLQRLCALGGLPPPLRVQSVWEIVWWACGLLYDALEYPERSGTAADLEPEYGALYPARCMVLDHALETSKLEDVAYGSVTVDLLYFGVADAYGEHPVLRYWQPGDAPGEMLVLAPGVDVWIARRHGLLAGLAGTRGFGLEASYAGMLQAAADANFAGCWAHEFRDVSSAHDLRDDLCARLPPPRDAG